MASEAQFQNIPHFPSDLPIVNMDVISLSGLLAGDPATLKSLADTCQELGFFFLDLKGNELGEKLINKIDRLFDLSKEVFDVPDEIKSKYAVIPGKGLIGYKNVGSSPTETGRDRYEMINLSRDALTGTTPPEPLPEILEEQRDLLTSFSHNGQSITDAICRALATALSIPEDTFASRHELAQPSNTNLRMIKTYASPKPEDQRTSMIHHTDIGSITLLANLIGGLQILDPDCDPLDNSAWRWVKPQPGMLIVNLGDVMVEWTAGLLRSNAHRIRYPPGEQSKLDRYNLAIIGRPASTSTMKRLIGPPSEEDLDMTVDQYAKYKLHMIKDSKWVMNSQGGKHGKKVAIGKGSQ